MKPPVITTSLVFLAAVLLLWSGLPYTLFAQQDDFVIAVVDLNRALNESQAGQRSKTLLLADKRQIESELQAKGAELKKMRDDLQTNILLNEEARSRREQELREGEGRLRQEAKTAETDLRNKERRYTESIFTELKTVISLISRDKKYDLVLEKAISQLVLFSTHSMQDITDQVIQRYDNIQNTQ